MADVASSAHRREQTVGQRDGRRGEVPRALNATLRWLGRVVGAGAVAGALHVLVYVLLEILAGAVTGDRLQNDPSDVITFLLVFGIPVGAAAGLVAGLLTAPVMVSRRLSTIPRARLAVVVGPAVLWFAITAWAARGTLGNDLKETLWGLYLWHLGPAAWMVAGLHLAARRFDPAWPRRPASRATPDVGARPPWWWAK